MQPEEPPTLFSLVTLRLRRLIDRRLFHSMLASIGFHACLAGGFALLLWFFPIQRHVVVWLVSSSGGWGSTDRWDGEGNGEGTVRGDGVGTGSNSAGEDNETSADDEATSEPESARGGPDDTIAASPRALPLAKSEPGVDLTDPDLDSLADDDDEEIAEVTVAAVGIARATSSDSAAEPSLGAAPRVGAALGRARIGPASRGVGSGTGDGRVLALAGGSGIGGAGNGTGAGASGGSAGRGTGGGPRPLYNPPPVYPPDALAARLTGRVVLRTGLNRQGYVLWTEVYRTSGVASLDQSAREAVLRWRFELRNAADVPEPIVVNVPVSFVISN